jgi:general secretion pathway protein J
MKALHSGFTLVELLTVLLILSLLALMSYRGLGAVLEARDHVKAETDKWRSVAAFFARFERDVQFAAPRSVRAPGGAAPPLLASAGARLEFSRFGSPEGADSARRVAYQLNDRQEIELLLWPGLDIAPGLAAARYPLLAGVARFQIDYFSASAGWLDSWPAALSDAPLPRAVRLRLALITGEEIVRIFELAS